MDPQTQFVADLTIALVGGVLAGWIARKAGLHPILGYIAVGLIVGPFTPGYVASAANLSILSELGLIFLLFSIGLEFKVGDIRKLGGLPLLLSFAAMGLLAVAGAVGAIVAGFPHAWTIGLILLLSSTAIGLALLAEAGLANQPAGRLALTILIVQDLLAVVLLVVVDQPSSEMTVIGLLKPLLLTAAFVALALTLGRFLIRRLVIRTVHRAPEEQQIVIFIGLAMAMAWIAHLFGLSFAFGAFIAGAVVAELAESSTVEHIVAPFKNLFVLCFFVAIGSTIDPALLVVNWAVVTAFGIAFAVVRWAVWYAFALRSGIASRAAALAGIAMIPLGEFNIVLAEAGRKAGRLDEIELATGVGVTFLSIVFGTLAQPVVMRIMGTRPAAVEPAG